MNTFIQMNDCDNLEFSRVEFAEYYIYVVSARAEDCTWCYIRTDKDRKYLHHSWGELFFPYDNLSECVDDSYIDPILEEIIQIEDDIDEATSILM